MNKKRIIPCLDIKDGNVVKGINFEGIRTVGDPVELAQKYDQEGADELVFLDITASSENRNLLLELIQNVVHHIQIPLIVGGGISSIERAQEVMDAGAAKISIGSAALDRPKLITELAKTFGKKRIVVAIDTKRVKDKNYVFSKGGKIQTWRETLTWAKEAEQRGAGEILLTSMDNDGVRKGFALEITDQVCKSVNIPVIASGGAGKTEDFIMLFQKTQADAGLAASIFHYGTVSIVDLKNKLKTV